MQRRTINFMALIAFGTVLVPVDAQAQIGRIKSIGTQIAKDAAGVPANPVPPPTTAPITADRLDAVIAVLAPRAERAEAERVSRAAEKEFEAWQKQYSSCMETATRAGLAPTPAGIEASGKYTEQQAPMLERMSKYIQGGNARALAYVQDSLRVLGMEAQVAMFSLKCGKVRYTPAAVMETRLAHEAQNASRTSVGENDSDYEFTVPSDKRAGMTHRQFGLVRERMALWALIQDGVIQPDKAGKNAVFTDEERKALTSRNDQIRKLSPLFRDNSLVWSSWGDIKSW